MIALNRKKMETVKERSYSPNGKMQEKRQGDVLSRKPNARDSLKQNNKKRVVSCVKCLILPETAPEQEWKRNICIIFFIAVQLPKSDI